MRQFPDPGLFQPTFVVWQDGHASPEHDGDPLGWDAAGDKLVVIHSLQPVDIDPFFDPRGWLEVLSWPGLQTLYANKSKDDIGDAAFDPSGSYVDYSSVTQDASGVWREHVDLINLSTGSVATISIAGDATGVVGGYVWNAQSQIVTYSDAAPFVSTYDAAGNRVSEQKVAPKINFQASADGSTLVGFGVDLNTGYSTGAIAYRDGSSAPLQPPGDLRSFSVSPDGKHILISVGSPTGGTTYIADVPL
jgi:dipeptidyl aminopeptidase/acylaminoacyl peptidase